MAHIFDIIVESTPNFDAALQMLDPVFAAQDNPAIGFDLLTCWRQRPLAALELLQEASLQCQPEAAELVSHRGA